MLLKVNNAYKRSVMRAKLIHNYLAFLLAFESKEKSLLKLPAFTPIAIFH